LEGRTGQSSLEEPAIGERRAIPPVKADGLNNHDLNPLDARVPSRQERASCGVFAALSPVV